MTEGPLIVVTLLNSDRHATGRDPDQHEADISNGWFPVATCSWGDWSEAGGWGPRPLLAKTPYFV
jgi:hypothetical protein